MTKIKNSVSEDWIVKTIVENGLNIFFMLVQTEIIALKNGDNKQFITTLWVLNLYFLGNISSNYQTDSSLDFKI